MEDRETPQTHKYGESKTTWIMMATVPHVTSGLGLRKFQADGFLFDRVYKETATLWLSMSVRLIRYMNKVYFHTDNLSASDTTTLLVPICKSTQVT